MRIRTLIVDDSLFTRKKLQDLLGEMPEIEICAIASNGEEAIDLALELKPDFITLDNVLPDMTGLQILNVLKGQLTNTKIVMISAVGQQSTIKEAMELGALHYFVKPLDPQDFKEMVTEILK